MRNKKQITQTDVNIYLHSKFAKSRLYHGQVINLEYGAYNLIQQTATISTVNLRKDFDFGKEEITMMLQKSISGMKFASLGQLLMLNEMFPHWQFFNKNIESGKEYRVETVHSRFKAGLPYEDKSLKNFYSKLRHWAVENNYHVNIKVGLFRKVLVVGR